MVIVVMKVSILSVIVFSLGPRFVTKLKRISEESDGCVESAMLIRIELPFQNIVLSFICKLTIV